jgi:hypothetical protein
VVEESVLQILCAFGCHCHCSIDARGPLPRVVIHKLPGCFVDIAAGSAWGPHIRWHVWAPRKHKLEATATETVTDASMPFL